MSADQHLHLELGDRIAPGVVVWLDHDHDALVGESLDDPVEILRIHQHRPSKGVHPHDVELPAIGDHFQAGHPERTGVLNRIVVKIVSRPVDICAPGDEDLALRIDDLVAQRVEASCRRR